MVCKGRETLLAKQKPIEKSQLKISASHGKSNFHSRLQLYDISTLVEISFPTTGVRSPDVRGETGVLQIGIGLQFCNTQRAEDWEGKKDFTGPDKKIRRRQLILAQLLLDYWLRDSIRHQQGWAGSTFQQRD